MTTLPTLLQRVREASGPDRELDVAIACGLFPTYKPAPELGSGVVWTGGLNGHDNAEVDILTASLDAAVALVERVRPGSDGYIHFGPKPNAVVWVRGDGQPEWSSATTGPFDGRGATPALALLAALFASLTL